MKTIFENILQQFQGEMRISIFMLVINIPETASYEHLKTSYTGQAANKLFVCVSIPDRAFSQLSRELFKVVFWYMAQ